MRAPRDRSSLFSRVRRDEGGHLDGLRVMHDHALHELDVGVGSLRKRRRWWRAEAFCWACQARRAQRLELCSAAGRCAHVERRRNKRRRQSMRSK